MTIGTPTVSARLRHGGEEVRTIAATMAIEAIAFPLGNEEPPPWLPMGGRWKISLRSGSNAKTPPTTSVQKRAWAHLLFASNTTTAPTATAAPSPILTFRATSSGPATEGL